MAVYDNVVYYAQKKGMPIYKVEQAAGLSKSTILKWKYHEPNITSVMAVAKVLGISMNQITKEDK